LAARLRKGLLFKHLLRRVKVVTRKFNGDELKIKKAAVLSSQNEIPQSGKNR